MINRYPYTDAHELNLDYILKKIKELNIKIDDFEVLNKITFSGVWDITKQYPKWTIVIDNNIGYISKEIVPSGILINNTDYWEQIIEFTDTVNLNYKILLIGDSYLDGGGVITTYGDYLRTLMPQSTITIYHDPGSGFHHYGVGGYTFETMLDQAISDISIEDRNTYTHVIAIGGSNDVNQSDTNVTDAIAAFVTKAKSAFINSKTCIGFCGWTDLTDSSSNKIKFIHELEVYRAGAVAANALFIEGLEFCMKDYDNFYNQGHPNSPIHERIAAFIEQWLHKGYAYYEYQKSNVTYTLPTGVTVNAYSDTPIVDMETRNDKTIVKIHGGYAFNNYGAFTMDLASGVLNSGGRPIGMFELSDGLCFGVEDTSKGTYVADICLNCNDGTDHAIPASVFLVNKTIYIAVLQGFMNYSSVSIMKMPPIQFEIPTLYA